MQDWRPDIKAVAAIKKESGAAIPPKKRLVGEFVFRGYSGPAIPHYQRPYPFNREMEKQRKTREKAKVREFSYGLGRE